MSTALVGLADVRTGAVPPAIGEDVRSLRARLPERRGDAVGLGAGPSWLRADLAGYPVDCYLPYDQSTTAVRVKGVVASSATVAARRVLCVSTAAVCLDAEGGAEPEWPTVLPHRGRVFARWKKDGRSVERGVDVFLDGGPRPTQAPMLDLNGITRRRLQDTLTRLQADAPDTSPLDRGVARLKVPGLQARVACLSAPEPRLHPGTRGQGRDELLTLRLETPHDITAELTAAVSALEHVLAHRWLAAVATTSLGRQQHQLARLLEAVEAADAPGFDQAALAAIRLRLQQQSLLGGGWVLGTGLATRAAELVGAVDEHLHLAATWASLREQDVALQRAVDLALRLRPTTSPHLSGLVPTPARTAFEELA